MNYNYIEIKTGLKGILERVPLQKIRLSLTKMFFYIHITILQGSQFFSDQICIE